MRVTFLVAVALAAFTVAGTAAAAELKKVGEIAIPGAPLNSFDISYIDAATGHYYLADRSNKGIDIVDTKTGAFVGRVGGMVGAVMKKDGTCCNNDASGPNGVLTVDSKEAWAGDGDSTVKVIDLKSMKIVDTISTGGKTRADEMAYDPKDKILIVANDAEEPPYLTLISTEPGHKVIGKIVIEHATDGIEQTQYNPDDGMFYTDVPELDKDKTKGALAVIDPKTAKIVKMIPVANCVPHGLAVGKNGMMFLGCNAKNPAQLSVVDSKSGKVVAEIPGVGGSDESSVNNKLDQYYSALNGNPGGPILSVVDAKTNKLSQKIPTGPGAHSVAASEANGRVYVPIAVEANGLKGGCGCITMYGAE